MIVVLQAKSLVSQLSTALKARVPDESLEISLHPDGVAQEGAVLAQKIVVKLGHTGSVRTTSIDQAFIGGADFAELKRLLASFAVLGFAGTSYIATSSYPAVPIP